MSLYYISIKIKDDDMYDIYTSHISDDAGYTELFSQESTTSCSYATYIGDDVAQFTRML